MSENPTSSSSQQHHQQQLQQQEEESQRQRQQQPLSNTNPYNDTSATSSFSELDNDDDEPSSRDVTAQQQSQQPQQRPPLHVVFIHLDWGIGGAEQLMLQLATASQSSGHTISLITTRCEPHHCFAALKPETGSLYAQLHIWGQWLPTHLLFGKFQAACSTLRLMYLAYRVAKRYRQSQTPDLIVLDVLPTPLFILKWFTPAALLFYCHFPDQLLLRRPEQRDDTTTATTTTTTATTDHHNNQNKKTLRLLRHVIMQILTLLQQWYRAVLNRIEAACMRLADVTCVNSQFTKQTVLTTFPALAASKRTTTTDDDDDEEDDLRVLYPALDTASLDEAAAAAQQQQQQESSKSSSNKNNNKLMIVSLNRYERKKNLELLIQAAAWFQPKFSSSSSKQQKQQKVDIVIAGGYDTKNTENVEYYQELVTLAQELQIPVDFRRSISDTERNMLLQQATAVVYTPSAEHFGIVPLEAMYAGTPVVAVRSGGPMETVVDGITGYLCEPTAASFGDALLKLLQDPVKARAMGVAAKQHVVQNFSDTKLRHEWNALVQATVLKGKERVSKHAWYYRRTKTVLYIMEAILTLLLYWMLSWLLRNIGILQEPTGAVWDSLTGWLIRLRRQRQGSAGGILKVDGSGEL